MSPSVKPAKETPESPSTASMLTSGPHVRVPSNGDPFGGPPGPAAGLAGSVWSAVSPDPPGSPIELATPVATPDDPVSPTDGPSPGVVESRDPPSVAPDVEPVSPNGGTEVPLALEFVD